MHIALLGGAFNPPHNGHTMIAQQVLDFAGVDEVWFLPNYGQIPPKPVAPVSDRLAMTRLIELPHVRVSTLGIDHALDGDTINLVPHLPREHRFVFIIGSDQLPTFHLWGRWTELLGKLPFLVFPRYGYPNEPIYEHMSVVSNELLVGSNISSTKIRARVKQGLPVEPFIHPAVARYIADHALYR